ncbi:hypothetical protein ACOMHN_063186 [Nucella lapillus]
MPVPGSFLSTGREDDCEIFLLKAAGPSRPTCASTAVCQDTEKATVGSGSVLTIVYGAVSSVDHCLWCCVLSVTVGSGSALTIVSGAVFSTGSWDEVENMEVQPQRLADLHHHGHHQFLQHVAHRSGNVGLKPREWELAKGPGS